MNDVKVYRTDEDGTIIATADGETVTFTVPASEKWKAGEPTKAGEKTETQEKNNTVTDEQTAETHGTGTTEPAYILHTKTKKFHKSTCGSLPTENRLDSSESRKSIIAQGYVPCKKCKP